MSTTCTARRWMAIGLVLLVTGPTPLRAESPGPEARHKILKGETLGKVVQRYYGTYRYEPVIAAFNIAAHNPVAAMRWRCPDYWRRL